MDTIVNEKYTVSVTKFADEQKLKDKTFLTGLQWQPLTGELHDTYEAAKAEITSAIAKGDEEKRYYKIDKYFVGE